MKQNIKRILLVLCMITCLFALSACQKTSASDEMGVDAQSAEYISVWVSNLLEQMTAMTEQELKEQIVLAEQNKDFTFTEGFQSWLNVKKDTGDFQQILTTEVAAEDSGFSCVIQAQYSNRKLEFKVFLDEEGSVTSMSFAPEYTVAEKMTKALMNTLMGMGTVFLVLIFIIFLIGCFKYINVFEQKFRNKQDDTAVISEPVPDAPIAETAIIETMPEDVTDNRELVAVITAAIAAAEGTSADGLVVRSIRRAPAAKWKKA